MNSVFHCSRENKLHENLDRDFYSWHNTATSREGLEKLHHDNSKTLFF